MIGSRAAIEYAARSPIDTTFPSTYAHLTLKLNRTPPEYNDASKLEALPRAISRANAGVTGATTLPCDGPVGYDSLRGRPVHASPIVSLRSSLQPTHDVITSRLLTVAFHHHSFWLQQPTAVWSLLLQGDSEGPTFIFRTARHYAAPS